MLSGLGQALVVFGLGGLALSLIQRQRIARTAHTVATASLWLAFALLGFALVTDRFELDYVADYSARDLPVWLKLATLWGGEQGTWLLLAVLHAHLARIIQARSATSGIGLNILAVVFTGAAIWFSPFAATADAVPIEGRGMNAHLTSVWMAIHPPAILLAYGLLWAPMGAALLALATGQTAQWRAMVIGPGLIGWGMLCIGLASGMWWAFQDFSYGQFWHWDPVQTAALIIWLLATAQLHGARHHLPGTRLPVITVLATIAVALCIPVALWIVRDPTLASSHRYLGNTGWPVAAVITIATLMAVARALWRRRALASTVTGPLHRQQRLLSWAAWMLVVGATAGAGALAYSYVCAAMQCPRDFAPFRGALLSWVSGDEAGVLAAAFDQWEVDHFIATPALLPVVAAVVLLVGYAFFKPLIPAAGWATLGFAVVTVPVALWLEPLRAPFNGTGVTTSHTVARLPLLEVMLLWCIWPVLGTAAWSYRAWRIQHAHAFRNAIPVAAIHTGVMAVFVGATVSMTLDTTRQAPLQLPAQYGQPIALSDQLNVIVHAPSWHRAADGAIASGASYQAVSDLSFQIGHSGQQRHLGATVYRDHRSENGAEHINSLRQRCLILDHRFARVIAQPGLMLHPVIDRSWHRDLQIWLPAPPPLADQATAHTVLLIARQFPLLSVLWTGLVLIICGASALVFFTFARSPS